MIEIQDLCKAYDHHILFDHFHLKISDHEIVAIMGPSGSGKSTLLNIIGCIDAMDEGTICFNHQEVRYDTREATKLIRNQIAYLFQNFALLDEETVYQNLLIALRFVKASKKKKYQMMDEMLEKVELKGIGDQKVCFLSGGQQQRVALARALLKPSEFLLCDEPTGSLDWKNAQKVMDLLLKYRGDHTIIIVTHDMNIAKRCDRIITLNERID
ncbi:MAG: ABC transporter ATP-binding protein [Intestinibaculum porci]|uniref:ABC transporter ATP-binding protein n=1 Tax=Intestinibaculum porci TaxID=2487118 RepID=UPI003F01069A